MNIPADCELVSTAWLLALKRELQVTKEKLAAAEDKLVVAQNGFRQLHNRIQDALEENDNDP